MHNLHLNDIILLGQRKGKIKVYAPQIFRRYKELYAPCVFIKLPIIYNKGRKEDRN